jgi:ATP-dependent RNA helicase DeaD
VPPARKRRAEVLLNLAGIDANWGTPPQADEIRKLDQERMLKDALFAEETTPEDLLLAQALLAERSAEDIAAALARLYRARLPSPEDIIDPGEHRSRGREERGRERDSRAPRGDDRRTDARSKPRNASSKSSARHGMGEGSVWFRASIGSRKNAEARWLLPMICRRGGIDKTDIGAIRVMDTTTEFEISARAADKFVGNLRRPDKEDNIRIEPLPEGPQGEPAAEKRPPAREREERAAPREYGKPWQDKPRDDKPRDDKPRDEKPWSKKPPGGKFGDSKPNDSKPRSEKAAGFDKERRYDKKRPFREKPAYAAKPKHDGAAKPAFGKKKKKKFRD